METSKTITKEEPYFKYHVTAFFDALEHSDRMLELNLTDNIDVFNLKYEKHIEKGFDGLEISDPSVVIFLDYLFQEFCKIPTFNFAQIKLKWGSCRFYSNLNGFFSKLVESIVNIMVKEKFREKYKTVIEKYVQEVQSKNELANKK